MSNNRSTGGNDEFEEGGQETRWIREPAYEADERREGLLNDLRTSERVSTENRGAQQR